MRESREPRRTNSSPYIKSQTALKGESNPELHLPGYSRGGRGLAKVGGRDTDRRNAECPAGRHFEDRVIESIDKINPEVDSSFAVIAEWKWEVLLD